MNYCYSCEVTRDQCECESASYKCEDCYEWRESGDDHECKCDCAASGDENLMCICH